MNPVPAAGHPATFPPPWQVPMFCFNFIMKDTQQGHILTDFPEQDKKLERASDITSQCHQTPAQSLPCSAADNCLKCVRQDVARETCVGCRCEYS